MTYAGFLLACRTLASKKEGADIDATDFAKRCAEAAKKAGSTKTYSAKYYLNMEAGGGKAPGRELLEAAAAVAGIKFEDCIRRPQELPLPESDEALLQIVEDALSDWRYEAAKDSALALLTMERTKRPKTGGRTRKKSG